MEQDFEGTFECHYTMITTIHEVYGISAHYVKKRIPIGYKAIGFRPPKKGELYLSLGFSVSRATQNGEIKTPVIILRKLEKEDVYSEEILEKIPNLDDYEFRSIKVGDTYILPESGILYTQRFMDFKSIYRLCKKDTNRSSAILFSQTVKTAKAGCTVDYNHDGTETVSNCYYTMSLKDSGYNKVVKIPKGYRCVGFRLAKKGETILSSHVSSKPFESLMDGIIPFIIVEKKEENR